MEQKKVVAERTDRSVHTARMLDEALRMKKGMDMRMSGAYVLFERNVIKINVADLEELLRCSEPDYSMRLAMFTFGLMFDVLPRMSWLQAGYPEGQSTRSGRRSSQVGHTFLSHIWRWLPYPEAKTFLVVLLPISSPFPTGSITSPV